MARYLVTGGCGFIGSHLCKKLLLHGDTVTVLDNLSTGRAENIPEDIALVRGDIRDSQALRVALEGMDGCFHLAAIPSTVSLEGEWQSVHRTNLEGTINLFEAAAACGRIPVIYASSAAVYGEYRGTPLRETSRLRPLSAYGADKAGCEAHAHAARHRYGMAIIGLRIFNAYGPGQNHSSPYGGVVSKFCHRIRNGEQVDIHSDGAQTRDFIFVADVVRALLRSMELHEHLPEVLNVCTGSPTSLLGLTRTIAELSNRRPHISFTDARPGDIKYSLGDPSRARKLLDLPRPICLHDGLAITLS